MLRDDERTGWNGFVKTEPRFCGEDIVSAGDGPDPPDVLCTTASNRRIGVELTKWVEPGQIKAGKSQEYREKSYLNVVASENEARPNRIGFVWLYPKMPRLKATDGGAFRSELLLLLKDENAKSEPDWDNPQGAPVNDFSGHPTIAKNLESLWIHPWSRQKVLPAGEAWIRFEDPGEAFTPEWMVQAAIDRIYAKIDAYQNRNLHALHSLDELHLLCYYSDESLLYDTPTHATGFDSVALAKRLADVFRNDHGVFNKLFLFHPHEQPRVMRIYPPESTLTRQSAGL